MLFEEKFLTALAFTIIVEIVVLFALSKIIFRKECLKKADIVFAGFFASFATLPYVWFVISPFVNAAFFVEIAEAFAICVEAIILHWVLKLKIQKAFIASIACNLASFILGLFLFAA